MNREERRHWRAMKALWGLQLRARLQSWQLSPHACNTGADRGLIADELEGEADQDWREGGEPRPLCYLPDGRGRHRTANVPGDFAAHRGATAAATISASVRRSMSCIQEQPTEGVRPNARENGHATGRAPMEDFAMTMGRLGIILAALAIGAVYSAHSQSPLPEAPSGFDDEGIEAGQAEQHKQDKATFDKVDEKTPDGLGPIYNAQSCRECHQNPVSGAGSQITELRVGHRGSEGHFRNPEIPIAHGTVVISGRSLVNDRAICPNAVVPDSEIQERVPETETIRSLRLSLSLLGDGFVEAVADQTFVGLANQQCKSSHEKICGQVLQVPIVEAPG